MTIGSNVMRVDIKSVVVRAHNHCVIDGFRGRCTDDDFLRPPRCAPTFFANTEYAGHSRPSTSSCAQNPVRSGHAPRLCGSTSVYSSWCNDRHVSLERYHGLGRPYLSKWASMPGSVRSLMPTTSRFGSFSIMRNAILPMRPNPLIATLPSSW